ncbi:Aromatic peroxygenase [Fusarium sp. NRRL 52700]|nr:Aromatic peroxygenase [Fusarium sp. NRRL 52700]
MSAEQLKTYQKHAKRSPLACPYSQEKRDAGEYPFAKEKRAERFDAKNNAPVFLASMSSCLPISKPAVKDVSHHLNTGQILTSCQGPCPRLNTLANHGHLPRDSVADMQTIIKATNEGYGMSLDLGGFLAVYGTVFGSNPVSLNPGYSIGGPSRFSQNILNGGGILGTPFGLSGSKYESDVSATRPDLYMTGNNFYVILERFVEYWCAIRENTPAPEQYSALAPFHYKSFQDSEKTKSHFFYSPFAGILVSPAVYSFPPLMMPNHSDEYPEGYLSREVFTSFFDVKGSKPGNFKVNQGWESIPENWYRRPVEDEFSIPDFLIDVLEHCAKHPRLLNAGSILGGLVTIGNKAQTLSNSS